MAAAPPAASSLVPEDASQAELRAALQTQQMELEGLRARLEAQKLSNKSVVPDLTLSSIHEFLGRDKIPQWVRESSAALKQFLVERQSPSRPRDRRTGVGPAATRLCLGLSHLGNHAPIPGTIPKEVTRPGNERQGARDPGQVAMG